MLAWCVLFISLVGSLLARKPTQFLIKKLNPDLTENQFEKVLIGIQVFLFIIGALGLYDRFISEKALKKEVTHLKDKTANINTISQKETRVGDVIYQRDGTTLNVIPVEKFLLTQLEEARKLGAKGNEDKALEAFDALEETYSDVFPQEAYIVKAKFLLGQEKYQKALDALEKIQADKLSSTNKQDCYRLMGFCYFALQDLENAKKYLSDAHNIDKQSKWGKEAEHNLRIIEYSPNKDSLLNWAI